MTELDAINMMLTRAGHQPVNSVLDDGTNDATVAKQVLDRKLEQILAEGWHFNTEILELTPTSGGKFIVSDNWLFIDTIGKDSIYNVTPRGNYLYDLSNNTDVFTQSSLQVRVIIYYNFNDLPYYVQNYVANAASLEYQQIVLNDTNVDALIRDHMMKAMTEARRMDTKQRDYNYVYNKRNSFKLAYRRTRYPL